MKGWVAWWGAGAVVGGNVNCGGRVGVACGAISFASPLFTRIPLPSLLFIFIGTYSTHSRPSIMQCIACRCHERTKQRTTKPVDIY